MDTEKAPSIVWPTVTPSEVNKDLQREVLATLHEIATLAHEH